MKIDRHLLYIASREVENAVIKQTRLWVPRREEVAAAGRLPQFATTQPTMVGAYYDICFRGQAVPEQQGYVDFFFLCHEAEVDQITRAEAEAMKARCARAYNTFLIEHQLFALCVESGEFDACYKSEHLDTSSSVDLAVRLGPSHYGFAIQLQTRNAREWIGIKRQRQERRCSTFPWPITDLDIEFDKMKWVAGIHIFTQQYGANLVSQRLRQLRLDDWSLVHA